MKFLKISMLVLVTFGSSSSAQSNPPTLVKDASAVTVTDLQVKEINISHVLAKIAYTYNVPISLEVATNEDTGVTLNKICRQADRFEMIRKL